MTAATRDVAVDFRVLGPLAVFVDGHPAAVGAPRVRAVLAILLIRREAIVSIDRFVDEMWPSSPPPEARALVHGYASRLRRALRNHGGPAVADRLVTRKPGYLLHAADHHIDNFRYLRLMEDACRAWREGEPAAGLAVYQRAEAMWRGDPFADVPATPMIAVEATRLAEGRVASLEEYFDAALTAGEHAAIIPALTELLAANSHREKAAAQLMLALRRVGRTADALEVYRLTRRRLADEVGIEPGHELKQLHQAILRAEDRPVAIPPRSSGNPMPAQLPPAGYGFVGRADEVARLDAMLGEKGDPTASVMIAALSGTAGVGKTTLALHWAHRVAGRFPDGQLYVQLRGFGPVGPAMAPDVAVRGFLEALQVAPHQLPATFDAQVALYRSLLAHRRMLIVLDNARDADQVRPLLPGAPGSLALVTSRNQLTGLVAIEGAMPIALDLLTTAEARQLLANRLGHPRVAAEPAAVDALVTCCARLPLALAIVAARAAVRPHSSLDQIAEELTQANGRLDALVVPDRAADLRAVFSWSYDMVSPGAAKLFRALGSHPGPTSHLPRPRASPPCRSSTRRRTFVNSQRLI